MSISAPRDATSVLVQLPEDVLRRLRERAAASHCAESELVTQAVVEYLDDGSLMHEAIEEGLAEAERGQLLEFDDVEHKLRGKIAERRAARTR